MTRWRTWRPLSREACNGKGRGDKAFTHDGVLASEDREVVRDSASSVLRKGISETTAQRRARTVALSPLSCDATTAPRPAPSDSSLSSGARSLGLKQYDSITTPGASSLAHLDLR